MVTWNAKLSYPLISVGNSILVNFMNLATDIGSFIWSDNIVFCRVCRHLHEVHKLDDKSAAQVRVQMQLVNQLEIQVSLIRKLLLLLLLSVRLIAAAAVVVVAVVVVEWLNNFHDCVDGIPIAQYHSFLWMSNACTSTFSNRIICID